MTVVLMIGCSSQYKHEAENLVELPSNWQTDYQSNTAPLSWQSLIRSKTLAEILQTALSNNHALRQQAIEVEISANTLYQSKMAYIPQLDLSFDASHSDSGTSTSKDYSLGASFKYEIDLLGRLNDAKRAAIFSYSATQADYDDTLRSLVTSVTSAWADVVEAQQLQKLRNTRLSNLEKNLAIIEAGYRSGLNQALEVYLARNDVESERSQLIQAEQSLADSRRALALLLGDYPENTLETLNEFPEVSTVLPPALPSELLMKRADIQAAWLRVLAQNASVAVAYKARFPSLSLNSSAAYSSNAISTLGDEPLSWSIAGSLLQPIFSAGSLKANERNQRAALEQAELAFQQTVYNAFLEVESGLQNQQTLEQRYAATLNSRNNAVLAEKLSFEQYGKGIVSYTTVLDAQQRAVDAEIALISLKKQIFINKVTLHEALAGALDFDHPAVRVKKDSPQ